ncbi:acyl-CoA synthetase [Sporolactobacillus sp. THM7-7]|nr:acyl-CoA synthetase [Sporolactobacillus sp. THM7-7]
MNITETYRLTAEKYLDRCAIHDKIGDLTYQDWYETVLKTARWLSACKYADNHRVGLYLRNSRFFLQCFTAAAAAGWTAVPLDPRWGRTEREEKIQLAGLSLIISESDWVGRCTFRSVRVESIDTVCSEAENLPAGEAIETDESDLPFYFGFTSGSTGHPKGFVRTQASWIHSFACNVRDLNWSADDRILVAGSLFNTHFLYAAVSGLYIGATVILMPSFSAEQCLHLMKTLAPSQVVVVPTMLESLAATNKTWRGRFHWLSSGAKCAVSTKRKMAAQFPNSRMDEFYGASELSFVSLCREEEDAPADSVGRPFFNVSVAIRTEDGSLAGPGKIGKIFVKSPLVFSHYVTETGTEHLPSVGEWVTVGDIGYLDRDGYLHIQGRENGMINYGGLNIFPEEMERVLQGYPDVEHAAVVGLPHRHWGEIPAAFIQKKRHTNLDKKRLRRYCLERLTAYKVPRAWFFLDKMPFTAGGKVDKRRLKERYKESVLWKKR